MKSKPKPDLKKQAKKLAALIAALQKAGLIGA